MRERCLEIPQLSQGSIIAPLIGIHTNTLCPRVIANTSLETHRTILMAESLYDTFFKRVLP